MITGADYFFRTPMFKLANKDTAGAVLMIEIFHIVYGFGTST